MYSLPNLQIGIKCHLHNIQEAFGKHVAAANPGKKGVFSMGIRKLLLALIPLCLIIVVVAVIVAGSLSNPSVSAQSQNGPISHLHQKIHVESGPYPGSPAIKPHLYTANPNEPTYTATDVENYIMAKGVPAGPLVPGAHMTFKEIVFVTAGQAALLPLGDETGYPSNKLVCYFLIHGPFYPLNKHEYDPKGPLKPVQYSLAIFDGVTGNFLGWGIPSTDINWSSYFKNWTPD
jgi:hypothetical protein